MDIPTLNCDADIHMQFICRLFSPQIVRKIKQMSLFKKLYIYIYVYMAPKNVHTLTPRTYGYVRKGEFRLQMKLHLTADFRMKRLVWIMWVHPEKGQHR